MFIYNLVSYQLLQRNFLSMNGQIILEKLLQYCNLCCGVNTNVFLTADGTILSYDNCNFYKIYSKLFGGLILILMPFYNIYGFDYLDTYPEKPLLPILNRLNVHIQCILVVITAFERMRCSRSQQLLKDEMVKLKLSSNPSGCRHALLFYSKYTCMILHGLVTLVGIKFRTDRNHISRLDVYLLMYYAILQYTLLSWIFAFFCILLQFMDKMDAINSDLWNIISTDMPNFDEKLNNLLENVYLIDRACLQLVTIFQFYIMALLLNLFVNNSILFYMLFLIIYSDSTYKYIAIFAIFLRLADVFLIILCCDAIESKRFVFIETIKQHRRTDVPEVSWMDS